MIPLVLAIKYKKKKCKRKKIIILPGEIITIPEISFDTDDLNDSNNSNNEIRSIIL